MGQGRQGELPRSTIRLIDISAVPALIVLILLMALLRQSSPFLDRGGLLLASLCTGLVLLSLVHVHEQGMVEEATCADCAHHVHHSHLASADFCVDNCVLCQMLSLPFVAAILLSVVLFSAIGTPLYTRERALIANGFTGNRSSRAPPFA